MSDLSVFRFAKKSWYALASAAGMYVGHFMAWLSASILYAYQLHLDPAQTDVLPGPMAYRAAGLAGILCVLIAGWTTANPTIYRAGLAFQAIMPNRSRFSVTLITGLVATLAGTFPAIAMKLLGFVALYGMLLMPMGAIIFADFWLLKKLRLKSYYAEKSRTSFYLPAGLTWFVTLGMCWWLVQSGRVQIYFVSLPGWFFAAGLYIVASACVQKQVFENTTAKTLAKFLSCSALLVLIAAPLLFWAGTLTLEQTKTILTLVTAVWFVAAASWMWKQDE